LALQQGLQPIHNRLDIIDIRLENIESRSRNVSAMEDDDVLYPPKMGQIELPNISPRSLGDLKSLAGNNLITIATYYNCNHGSAAEKRKKIMLAYGIAFQKTQPPATITTI
jgi:hypothetical protein